jgi:broad specificity phosphatase PhoE
MWYIFRHGETFANLNKNMIKGYTKNIFLTFNGFLQAHVNGLKLKNTREDLTNYRVICSPLERAINTCRIIMDEIGRGDEQPEYEELVLERTQGIFDGIQKDKLKELFPKEYKIWKENPWSCEFEGYENYKTSLIIAAKVIEKYKNETNLIIVAHEGTFARLFYLLKNNRTNFNDTVKWIESLSTVESAELYEEIRLRRYDQNYFYSWNGQEFNII